MSMTEEFPRGDRLNRGCRSVLALVPKVVSHQKPACPQRWLLLPDADTVRLLPRLAHNESLPIGCT